MGHLYHVSMIHITRGATSLLGFPLTGSGDVTVYRDCLLHRSEQIQWGNGDYEKLHEYMKTQFFPDSDHGPTILSLTYHGERDDPPSEDAPETPEA